MYKIFVNDKLICFTDNSSVTKDLSNCLVIHFFQAEIAILIIDILEKDKKLKNVVVLNSSYKQDFELFKSYFKVIKAAGGVVINSEHKKLFIYRLNKWDLPKGKLEKNEGVEEAAIREVEEECGIKGLKTVRMLPDTFHIYSVNEKVILKQTHWFVMNTDYDGELVPQTQENITKAVWLSDKEVDDIVLKNTYNSITELLKTAI